MDEMITEICLEGGLDRNDGPRIRKKVWVGERREERKDRQWRYIDFQTEEAKCIV